MSLTKDQRKFQRLLDQLEKKQTEVFEFRKQLSENCNHPEEFVQPYTWEHDNGYGRQTKHDGRQCHICWKVNRWPHINPDRWADPC